MTCPDLDFRIRFSPSGRAVSPSCRPLGRITCKRMDCGSNKVGVPDAMGRGETSSCAYSASVSPHFPSRSAAGARRGGEVSRAERCSRDSVGQAVPGLLRSSVRGSQAHRGFQTNSGSVPFECVSQTHAFPHGDNKVSSSELDAGRLGDLVGFHRCVLSRVDPSVTPEVATVCVARSSVSFSCTAVRPQSVSLDIHDGCEATVREGSQSRYSHEGLPRRLGDHEPESGGVFTPHGDGPDVSTGPRIRSLSRKAI